MIYCTLSPILNPVNGTNVLVIHTSAEDCTIHVASDELFPVVYSGLALVTLAVWLNVVPTGYACVIIASIAIAIVCPGFRILK